MGIGRWTGALLALVAMGMAGIPAAGEARGPEPGAGAQAPAMLPGPAAGWNMTPADLSAAEPGLDAVDPPRIYGAGLEGLFLREAGLGGLDFRFWYQFDTQGLRQVLGESRTGPEGFETLAATLADAWGAPDESCARGAAGAPEAVEAIWRRAGAVIHLILLDPGADIRLPRARGASPMPRVAVPGLPATPRPALPPLASEPRRPDPDLPDAELHRMDPAPGDLPPPRFSARPADPPAAALPEAPRLRRTDPAPSPRRESRLLLRWHDPDAGHLASVTCAR